MYKCIKEILFCPQQFTTGWNDILWPMHELGHSMFEKSLSMCSYVRHVIPGDWIKHHYKIDALLAKHEADSRTCTAIQT